MDKLRQEIVDICKDFINVTEQLYKSGKITYDQYSELIELKVKYINENPA